ILGNRSVGGFNGWRRRFNRRALLDRRVGLRVDRRRGSGFLSLGRFFSPCSFVDELGGIALDEHALLSHLYLNRARPPRTVGLPDFGGLTAGQGDFLALAPTMGAAQRIKEFRLIRVGDGIVNRLEFNASGTQLLQQYVRRHFQFNSELGDGVTRHSTLSCLLLLFSTNTP